MFIEASPRMELHIFRTLEAQASTQQLLQLPRSTQSTLLHQPVGKKSQSDFGKSTHMHFKERNEPKVPWSELNGFQ